MATTIVTTTATNVVPPGVVTVPVDQRYQAICATIRRLCIGQIVVGLALCAYAVAMVFYLRSYNLIPGIICGCVSFFTGLIGTRVVIPQNLLSYPRKSVIAVMILCIICIFLSIYLSIYGFGKVHIYGIYGVFEGILAICEGILALLATIWCCRIVCGGDFGAGRTVVTNVPVSTATYPPPNPVVATRASQAQPYPQQQYLQPQPYLQQQYSQPYLQQQYPQPQPQYFQQTQQPYYTQGQPHPNFYTQQSQPLQQPVAPSMPSAPAHEMHPEPSAPPPYEEIEGAKPPLN